LEQLFVGILEGTKNLAVALQILGAVGFNTAFEYNRLLFDEVTDAKMRFFKSHSIPKQYTGFFIVVGTTGIHSLVLVSIIWRFSQSQALDQALPVRDPLLFNGKTGTPVAIRDIAGRGREPPPAVPVGRGRIGGETHYSNPESASLLSGGQYLFECFSELQYSYANS
jgi:hypothetical protein